MLLVAVTRTRSSARTEQLDVTEARRVGRIVLHMSRHLKPVIVHVICEVCKPFWVSYRLHSCQSLENIVFMGNTLVFVWTVTL